MQKCNVALVNRFSGRRKTNMADGKDREDETSFLLLEVLPPTAFLYIWLP